MNFFNGFTVQHHLYQFLWMLECWVHHDCFIRIFQKSCSFCKPTNFTWCYVGYTCCFYYLLLHWCAFTLLVSVWFYLFTFDDECHRALVRCARFCNELFFLKNMFYMKEKMPLHSYVLVHIVITIQT